MNFDWDKFKKEKIAVHTKTQKECDDFFKQVEENGLEFFDRKLNYFYRYEINTCICYFINSLGYSNIDFYKANNYKIIEWSDYMNKELKKEELKKEDLKAGYVVKFENDELAIVAPVDSFQDLVFIYPNGTWDRIENHITEIKEVYGYSRIYANALAKTTNNRKLLWEKGVKEVTMAEIEEKFGCKVKIVKDN